MNVVWTGQTEDSIHKIIDCPELFKVSQYDNESREAMITKYTILSCGHEHCNRFFGQGLYSLSICDYYFLYGSITRPGHDLK
ncbi:hypothetical protein FGF1_02810 [Flavobacteriaceae bacterium GF1]